jgi:glycosyltransferase involved in cell wall biosynthesis
MISAVVLTQNSEKSIEQCFKSLNWCDEIIVVDDYSQKTVLTESQVSNLKSQNYMLNLKTYKRHLGENFAEQRNYGLEKANGNWILFVDSDEVVTQELKQEIINSLKNSHQVNGFFIKRRDKFMGQWLNHGETAAVKLLRLAKKGTGKWAGRVHEEWKIKGPTKTLTNPLLHSREMSVTEFLSKVNEYSTLRASELAKQGIKTNIFLILIYPIAKFIQNYILRLGFLDGMPGFAMAFMMSLHSFLVRAKLYLGEVNL